MPHPSSAVWCLSSSQFLFLLLVIQVVRNQRRRNCHSVVKELALVLHRLHDWFKVAPLLFALLLYLLKRLFKEVGALGELKCQVVAEGHLPHPHSLLARNGCIL